MAQVKKITYKIQNGLWKHPKFANDPKLKYTYPILLVCLEDIKGGMVEVSLNYHQIADMIQGHIFLERYVDSLCERKVYSHKVIDGVNLRMLMGKKASKDDVEDWIKTAKKNGGFKENGYS